MEKPSKLSYSTKWRLRGNDVLQLMECLTLSVSFDMVMVTISHLFICLPTLELTTFEQQVWSTKMSYTHAISLETNKCVKKNVITMNGARQEKKERNFGSGWLEQQQGGLHSFF